jgi:DNA phosphorothioation-dependent restriction protein DptH
VNAFIDYLDKYVQSELSSAFNAAPGQELRVFFSGPPLEVLNELFEKLVSQGEYLEIEVGGSSIRLPVFVLDASAEDPDRLRSARCTPNYLVKVRTSRPAFLALHPPSESSVLSLESATTKIGIAGAIDELESWMSHPLVDGLIQDGLCNIFHGSPPRNAYKAISYVLEESWELDERFKDHRHSWEVLRRLFDCQVPQNKSHETALAILGLPNCDPGELGTDEHLKILDRIGDLLENSGLNPGFDSLEEQADDELRPFVSQFRQHISYKYKTASDFSSAPAKGYSPISRTSVDELPNWWLKLTIEAWNKLLDSSPESMPQNLLRVTPIGLLTPSVRGMPILFKDEFKVEISLDPSCGAEPVNVHISRASGGKKLDDITDISVSSDKAVIWTDTNVPIHDRHVRYQFSATPYKPVSTKCIVLNCYVPGIALYCRNANKITPFKLNQKARNEQGYKIERYECEINVHGTGTHQLDIYKGKQVVLGNTILGYEADAEHGGIQDRPINITDDNHAVSIIETDEECHCEFVGDPKGDGDQRPFRVWITADDLSPTGAASEFDRLLIEHRAAATGDHVSARVELSTSRVTDLQIWAIENEDSFHPLILGPDYINHWSKPNWSENPVFSAHTLMLDPRPQSCEFNPPAELVEARRHIQAFLRPQSDEPTSPVEMALLSDLMCNAEFAGWVKTYLQSYLAWLDSDYHVASWMDVVSLHRCESAGDTLEPNPYAILLTPLHPIRFAWQCQAQQILKDALDKHSRCPGASVLDPCSFPDCMIVSCRTAAGRSENRAFLALANTSDYWGVLWNKDLMAMLNSPDVKDVFNFEFGILVEGLSTGFSVEQVRRSMEEVSKLSSARSTLQISIESDTNGSSSCNEGISRWCSKFLGPDGDAWYEAGPKSIHIHDYRSPTLHPEQASLASLTAESGATVRWFTPASNQARILADLAIVAHLGVSNPDFQIEGLRSSVDPTGLTRKRIRKQLAAASGKFIAEARVGLVPPVDDPESLSGLLLRCIDRLESNCTQVFDSYVFAPKMPTLEGALQSARYCAVSSSTVDSACFFRATGDSYLWDYELPSYSRRAGENSAYFLLAKESPSMVRAVQSAVKRLAPNSEIPSSQVSSLLREISRRGMPTLKRLTSGGATSLGEVGMLVALRILQTEFEDIPRGIGLAPVRAGNLLNLVIPVDPFQNHFEALQSAIQHHPGERPDLLIASIRFIGGKAICAKITPIEVKARGEVLSQPDRHSALGQASSFGKFLCSMKAHSQESSLWGVAWRSLVGSWLDYSFRVYGQLEIFMRQEEWSQLNSSALAELMSENLDIEIDTRGRLFVIDHSNSSCPVDIDGDGFRETVVLSHADAFSLLTNGDSSFAASIPATLGDWGLSPESISLPSKTEPPGFSTGTVAVDPNIDATLRHDSVLFKVGIEAITEKSDVLPKDTEISKSQAVEIQDKPTEPAAVPSGIRFRVGRAIHAFQEKDLYFFPGNTELNQLNVGIVGDLGTGKTQLVQALIYQLRRNPENNRGERPKILIFDYKKDYSKSQFVEATGARIVSPFNIPLNLFDTRDCAGRQAPWLERTKFFADILGKLYPGIGPAQYQRIKQAVREAYERANVSGHGAPTIYDVFEAYQSVCHGQIDSPFSIMSDIVDGGYFVRGSRDVVPFSEFLDGVIVVDLGSVGQDDRTKNMLVVIFLNLFYEHMLKIEKRPFIGQSPRLRYLDTMLLVDEADNIMRYEFEVLKRVLLQGREFGVGVILASQYLSHFRTKHENYLEPLLTWFVHKVPNITVRELEAIGLTRVDMNFVERIKTLACHECLYKTYDIGSEFMRADPFYEIIENAVVPSLEGMN